MKEKNKRKCVNGSESLRLNLRNGRGGVSVSVKKKGKITTWMQGEVVGAQHSKRLLRRAMRPDPQNLISADPEPKPARGGGSNHWNKETGRNKNNTTRMRTAAGSFNFKEMYDRNIEIPSLIDWLDVQGKQHWNWTKTCCK